MPGKVADFLRTTELKLTELELTERAGTPRAPLRGGAVGSALGRALTAA
ncbi:hypothetical protein ABT084_11605 [Streptomyces sp. NPDC002138]